MNQTKQRTAIAEHLGYIDVREYAVDMDDDCLWLMGRKSQKEPLEYIEYYTNDLNAMHEAENILTVPQQLTFFQYLSQILETNHDGTHKFGVCMYWETTHANAAQRAEAFLKTIGKWEDDSICFKSMDWKCKDEI